MPTVTSTRQPARVTAGRAAVRTWTLTNLRHVRTQSAASFGTLIAALTVFLSYVFGGLLIQQFREDHGQSLRVVSDNVALTLARGLEDRRFAVEAMARDAELWGDGVASSKVRAALMREQAAGVHRAWVGVTDAQGTIRAATSDLLVGASVAQRDWFLEGAKASYVGDVHLAKLLAKLLPASPSGEPLRFVDFSAPIQRDGKLLGVLAEHGSWDWTRNVVKSLTPQDGAQRELDLFIFDRKGDAILAPEGMKADDVKLPVERAKAERSRGSEVLQWSDGKTYLTAAAALPAHSRTGDLGWLIVAREPVSKAYAPVQEMAKRVGVIAIAACAFAALLGWYISGRLSHPLAAIAKAARDVTAGQPGAQIPICTDNTELSQLSHALSSMTARLLAHQQELEDKVRERTAQLEAVNQELVQLSRHDPLTGLMNRRALDERLTQAVAMAKRSGKPLSLLTVDADHFKKVNDTFGHDVGDEVLKALAVVLQGRLRTTDSVARMGGEEFVVLLPDTDAEGALLVAQELVVRAASTDVPVAGTFTISVGCVTTKQPPESKEELLKASDRALYAAKQQGRNRVVVAE